MNKLIFSFFLILPNVYLQADESVKTTANINNKKIVYHQEFLKNGYLKFNEKKFYYKYNNKIGPFICNDDLKKENLKNCNQTFENKYWFDLKKGKYETFQPTKYHQNPIIFNNFLMINFLNSIAVVSFQMNFMSFIYTNYYNMTSEGNSNFIPNMINCSSDGNIVFEIIKNDGKISALQELDTKDIYLNEFINNSNYPYVLKYIDDDNNWHSESKFGSGRAIYIFLGIENINVISKINDLVCTSHYLINKKISIKNIKYGYR